MKKDKVNETSVIRSINDMPVDELAGHAEEARGFVGKIVALLPGLTHLSVDERVRTSGRFQAGEPAAVKKILVAAGKHPHLFAVLADKDGGKDPQAFEPQPALDDLGRVEALQNLAHDLASVAQAVNDSLLVFGARVRVVSTPVHTILKANKDFDPSLASDAAEGLEFYAARGRRAARAQAKAKAATATDPTKPSTEA
jgi:hypothetical protein